MLASPFCLYVQVKLKDSLMSSISFSQAKEAELAWVDGQIHFSGSIPGKGESKTNGNVGTKELNVVPVLDALTLHEVGNGGNNISI